MIRNQEDDRFTERSSTFYSTSEIPKRPYRVTVEFPLFLVMISTMLTGAAIGNLILYRTCLNSLGYSHEECKGFLSPVKTNNTKALEQEVQKYATIASTVKSVLEAIGPAIMSLFLGAWSDTYGRKPLMTWSLFGITLTAMSIVVYSMIDSLGPWWYILTALPVSMTGGLIVLFTASYCYISDVSSTEHITLRMALVDATVSVGMVIGDLLAKDLILTVGSTYLLLIGAALNTLAYFYVCIYIPESLTGALQGGFSKVFDISLLKEMTRECLKKRPNNAKAQILLLTVVRILAVIVLYGSCILEYMYTRQKLHWGLSDYTTFSAVATTIVFFGGFFGIFVGQNLIGVSDLVFSIFATFTAAVELFIKAFAVSSWHMYLASAVSLFKGLAAPLTRSYLSKILPVEDISKVFAMMCAVEGITPLVAPIMFTTVYMATISTFPGAFYVLSGSLTVLCVILLGFVKYYSYRPKPVTYGRMDEEL